MPIIAINNNVDPGWAKYIIIKCSLKEFAQKGHSNQNINSLV